MAGAKPSVVLAVLEVPMAAVVSSAVAARDRGARFVVNAAPAQALPDALLQCKLLIVVNADELREVGPSADTLLERGAEAVIVTRGREGAAVITADGERSVAGEDGGPVIDATGAGDSFCGALAALLAEGLELEPAALMANAAAALSVRRAGARGGMATWAELDAYLRRSQSV